MSEGFACVCGATPPIEVIEPEHYLAGRLILVEIPVGVVLWSPKEKSELISLDSFGDPTAN
jgi:hypothetical protein